jgi:hypothetical protein
VVSACIHTGFDNLTGSGLVRWTRLLELPMNGYFTVLYKAPHHEHEAGCSEADVESKRDAFDLIRKVPCKICRS